LTVYPYDFYETAGDVDPSTVAAIVAGVPRSGSTFAWQVVRDVIPGNKLVVKTHKFLDLPETIPVIATVRDPRDCIVSHWRKGHPTARSGEVMTPPEIRQWATRAHEWFTDFQRYQDERPKAIVLRYETGLDSWAQSIWLRWPGRPPCLADCYSAAGRHEFAHNKRFASKLKAVDPATQLHPGHCHEGAVGSWRNFLDSDGIRAMNDATASIRERYCYG
jgi:hypothetical protein